MKLPYQDCGMQLVSFSLYQTRHMLPTSPSSLWHKIHPHTFIFQAFQLGKLSVCVRGLLVEDPWDSVLCH